MSKELLRNNFTFWRRVSPQRQREGNSSAQDFALAAKSVRIYKFGQENLPLAEDSLEWADSVTGKPKAELLQEKSKT